MDSFPRDEKQMERALQLPELIASREFSGHGAGEGSPGRTLRTPRVELIELRVQGNQRGREFTGQCTEEERAAWRSSYRVCGRAPWVFSRLLMYSFPWGSHLRLAKGSPKGLEGTMCLTLTQHQEHCLFLQLRLENLVISNSCRIG